MYKLNKKVSNPMTVIAMFALISETSAAVSLPFLANQEREIYIWFLISFPFYLLFLFFLTLNFNYRSLYAPSDFTEDENFLRALDDEVSIDDNQIIDSENACAPNSASIVIALIPELIHVTWRKFQTPHITLFRKRRPGSSITYNYPRRRTRYGSLMYVTWTLHRNSINCG